MNDRQTQGNKSIKSSCICGVVSLLECVQQQQHTTNKKATELRAARRALRSKNREFITRAQVAWGTRGDGANNNNSSSGSGGGSSVSKAKQKQKSCNNKNNTTTTSSSSSIRRRCHQPRHLPLPLNPNTRVTFAYELTSIAIVVDASPSLMVTLPTKSSFDWFSSGEEEKKSSGGNSTTTLDDDDDDNV